MRSVEWLNNSSLGQQSQAIPWWCWETSGFKSCHAAQWEAARSLCDPDFGGSPWEHFDSVQQCLDVRTNLFTEEQCVKKLCPREAGPPPGAEPPAAPPPTTPDESPPEQTDQPKRRAKKTNTGLLVVGAAALAIGLLALA